MRQSVVLELLFRVGDRKLVPSFKLSTWLREPEKRGDLTYSPLKCAVSFNINSPGLTSVR